MSVAAGGGGGGSIWVWRWRWLACTKVGIMLELAKVVTLSYCRVVSGGRERKLRECDRLFNFFFLVLPPPLPFILNSLSPLFPSPLYYLNPISLYSHEIKSTRNNKKQETKQPSSPLLPLPLPPLAPSVNNKLNLIITIPPLIKTSLSLYRD